MPVEDMLGTALGRTPADAAFENAEIFSPFTCSWERASFAVRAGIVVGIGDYRGIEEHDLHGARVVPGLIDSHVHIESSLLTPSEFGRLALRHGTTTAIADPHEIANVCGIPGIEFMLRESARTPLDIFYMLPSCVPATPQDSGGAMLSSRDLASLSGREGIIGVGEVMNVPGVLRGDAEVLAKIALLRTVDGHAPGLTRKELNAYILAGIQSDHESTTFAEAREKLKRGMYIYMREGSAERNLRALAPLADACTTSRCSFATDDRSTETLEADGQIDDCIRKAVEYGMEPEIALRMATLTPSERFGLSDRGAIAPGRWADFCIVDGEGGFRVLETYKKGIRIRDLPYRRSGGVSCAFESRVPERLDLAGAGEARVIGLVQGEIRTRDLRYSVESIPDTERDILKVVVCDRYRNRGFGLGLVHGLGFSEGAIAASVSHDAHNIVAAGVEDSAILRAIGEVIALRGGMVAVSRGGCTRLPLECAGLMSEQPYDEVARRLRELQRRVAAMGGIEDAFMYLSFLALTVIPELRVTIRGPFDAVAFRDVPLFVRDA
ncbi:MAG: adenine deaminase [Methanomicrobiales archaeon]|nr:adenine deaminase [Methanomicrobiales archaeon]